MKINNLILNLYSQIDKNGISRETALALAKIKNTDILDLASLANKTKNKFSSDDHVCTIFNAKSGKCTENCKYCAQSGFHKTEIEIYPYVDDKKTLAAAKAVYDKGVRNFGIVTSGLGYTEITLEFEKILHGIKLLYQTFPDINVCASIGILSQKTADALAKAGVKHSNHNLQVNPKNYAKFVSTTHKIEDRIQTIKWLKQAGIKACTGGIIGLGESLEDRIEMAFALKELDVDVIPLNVLIPIDGTSVKKQPNLTVAEITKTFAIFRLIHPTKIIKFAAGRETVMKDFQALIMLAGANGLLTGGYLTTRGRSVEEDQELLINLSSFSDYKTIKDFHGKIKLDIDLNILRKR